MSTPMETGHFSARDGIQLHYQLYSPAAPRGSVLVMHGFAEHGGRYGHLVDALVPKGFAVMTYDHRGHGQSGGRRVFIERFDEYVADAALAVELAKKRLPGPLFVVSHSMGGVVALLLAAQKPAGISGWVFSNPALHAAVDIPGWKVALARCASKALPTLEVPSGIPPEHISRDPDEVRQYAADPLCSKQATARWYTEFTAAQQRVRAAPEALAGVPVIGLIGEGDRIIDPTVSVRFFAALSGPDAVLRRYPGLYHEIFNELAADREIVLADAVAWLEQRAPA